MGMGPFGPEIYKMLEGLSCPTEPGIHGIIEVEQPKPEALEFVIGIRDQCEEFIRAYGKDEESQDGKEDGDELQGRSEKRKGQGQEKDGDGEEERQGQERLQR